MVRDAPPGSTATASPREAGGNCASVPRRHKGVSMDLLHDNCGGLIETFDPEDYGLCTECGTEGYFRVIREDPSEDAVYAVFHDVICVRQ